MATFFILVSGVLLRTRPLPAVLRLLAGGGGTGRPAPAARRRDRIARCVAAVRRAKRVLRDRPTCLSRSIALAALLRLRGVAATIRIGVADTGGEFHAHAWVEAEDGPVGEPAHVAAEFLPLRGAG